MKVWIAPEAEADLQATLDFIQERNPAAAVALAIRVFDTLEKLAAGGFRIYYQRRQDMLYVLRIYHHARRPITK